MGNHSRRVPRRALLSVSDRRGLVAFARTLAAHGVVLVSTGGTARALRDAGLDAIDVAAVTGFPEIMDGRVKTLHPAIHGGLLARDGIDDAVSAAHAIEPIDLVVVNLYPFRETIADPRVTEANAVEQIDIGGPAMLRAAAKNHARVIVVVDPDDYEELAARIAAGGCTFEERRGYAARAFDHVARYDAAIAMWLGARAEASTADAAAAFPPTLHLGYARKTNLRYGENPHQRAALYVDLPTPAGTVAGARVLAGKALSYNNLADADAALACVKAFNDAPACVIVKHANPCGVALAASPGEAYRRAHATDPTSAFGGIIAFNRALDAETCRLILDSQFVEVLIAPTVDAAALALLAKKPNVRVLATGAWPEGPARSRHLKAIDGGLLVQDDDRDALGDEPPRIVTARAPGRAEMADLLFAWRVAMHVKSNAIVFAREGRTLGIGAGQMSRIDSVRIAEIKAGDAGLALAGAALASDAFFPFRDGVDAAAKAGVGAVIQPGGSLRDAEVIDAADAHRLAMVFTGRRHFRH